MRVMAAPRLLAFAMQNLRWLSNAPEKGGRRYERHSATPIFAKEKPRNVERGIRRRLKKDTKERIMEYLILVAVVSMMALYALIIVGCLRQPEW
jgi:hypothetical protein